MPQPAIAVAVVGATGHTGHFVVSELARRGLAPIAIGRDRARLDAMRFRGATQVTRRHAPLDDPAALDRALAGAAVVVNCAGPFLDTADAVVAAALRARIPYLDVTAEQPAARAIFETFDAAARAAGVVVVPAMGFFGGFADLLVSAAMADWDRADAIDIAVGLDRWHPTQGTRITGERNTAPRVVIRDGRLAPATPAERDWNFAAPIGAQRVVAVPLSEIILIARHVQVREVRTYLSAIGLSDLRDPATPTPQPAAADGRSAQRFAVEVVVRRGDERRQLAATGQDIYAFSAPLVCEAARRLARGEVTGAGVRAPGEIFDAKQFLAALVAEQVIAI